MEHSSRPRQDRYRRSSSSYDLSLVSRGASSSPGTAPHLSSESSRAPSATGQPTSSSGDKNSATRPPSMPLVHSSEDVRLGPQSRRNSVATSLRPLTSRASTYPMWPSNFLVSPAPPVPPFMSPYMMPLDPSLSMDMPLLPPVPPFMLQQHSRRSSRHSNSSTSPVGTSANSSLDLPRSGHSLPPSSSSSRTSGFNVPPSARRPNTSHTDPRRASMPISTVKDDRPERLPASRSQPQASRRHTKGGSKPAQPGVQLPSPWTALPTKTGAMPAAMPRSR